MTSVNLGPFKATAETEHGKEQIQAICFGLYIAETVKLPLDINTQGELAPYVGEILRRVERQLENLILSLRAGKIEFATDESGVLQRIVLHYDNYEDQGVLPS